MESKKPNSLSSMDARDAFGKRKQTSNHIQIDSSELANKKVTRGQDLTTFNEEKSRRELARMFILHDYPFSMVEHAGFRRFVASLQPGFHMIPRNTLKNDILKIYSEERFKRYRSYGNLKCRIAITIDMWTSNNKNKGFMAISGHYIDDSWVLQSFILRFIYVPAPHTVEALVKYLVEALMDRNVDHRLSTITVANSTTNDAMLAGLLEKFPKKDMLLDGKVLHMHCYAHILNLIAEDGLGVINGAIERIRDSVVYWTASRARIQKFKYYAFRLNIYGSKKLSLDCKTRWDSTYLMLETAIVYKDVFSKIKSLEEDYEDPPSDSDEDSQVESLEEDYIDPPTDEDWMNTIEICGKLKCIYQVAEKFSKTSYPTSNLYLQNICDIKLKLNEWVTSPNGMIQDMATKMLEKYDKYLDNCLIMMGVAAVLDPRYKMTLVEFLFPKVYGERSQSKIDQIRHNCCELLREYKSAKMSSDSSSTRVYPSGNFGVTRASTNTLEDEYDKFVASCDKEKTCSTFELDLYLEENVLPRTQNFDVLSWWKTNGVKYPTLQSMARDVLAIRISTCASRSAFSTSERLLSPHFNRLHPRTVEALMCTRSWLWKDANCPGSTFCDLPICPSKLDEEEEEEY